jgi:ion channel
MQSPKKLHQQGLVREGGLWYLQERFRDPLLTMLTVMLAAHLFVVAPVQAAGVAGAHLFGFAFALVLLAAVFVVSRSALALAAILVAIALIVVAAVMRLHHRSIADVYLDAVAWLIAGLAMSVVVSRAVFAPGRVTLHRVMGAILLYLNIGLIFAALFCFVDLAIPNAFTGLAPKDNFPFAGNLIYFSFVTLTSVGYGDIVPLHPYARSLANVEAIIGQLYPATLLARLVTLELQHRHGS